MYDWFTTINSKPFFYNYSDNNINNKLVFDEDFRRRPINPATFL